MDIDYIKQKALVRILDDDEALGEALKLYLELEGWRVAVYTQARRFFAEDLPSVPGCIVLDVRMPEINGLECQRMLNERKSANPIIFISGHGDIDMAVQTILNGAYDFLQKPVDEERLVRSVARAAGDSVMKADAYRARTGSCQTRGSGPCEPHDRREAGHFAAHGRTAPLARP